MAYLLTKNDMKKCPVVYLDESGQMDITARIKYRWSTGGTVGGIHHPSGKGKFNEIDQ